MFNKVFVLDCTYCTNMYRYPFLNVIGITSTYKTFYSCFFIIRSEDQYYCTWALNQLKQFIEYNDTEIVFSCDREMSLVNSIKTVFQLSHTIVCIWHISKNILSNTKPDFKTEEEFNEFIESWVNVVYSKTEKIFNENYDNFKLKYSNTHPKCILYIQKTWIVMKENFISCYVNVFLHFGSNSNSRVEGFHKNFKQFVDTAKCHLYSIVKKIDKMIRAQKIEIKQIESREKLVVPTECQNMIFTKINRNISLYAINMILEQLNIADIKPCTGLFSKSTGIPCVHKLRIILSTNLFIPISSIDRQWHLNREVIEEEYQPKNIFEAIQNINKTFSEVSEGQKQVLLTQINGIVKSVKTPKDPKIRDSNSKGRKMYHKKSKKRSPSQYEIVEKDYHKYKCLKCKKQGHILRNCPN